MSGRSSQSSTDWGYTSYENYSAGRKSSSSSRQTTNREAFDESYEEFGTEAVGRKMALASLKTPEINPWDNMVNKSVWFSKILCICHFHVSTN